MNEKQLKAIPNILTCFRIFLIPALLVIIAKDSYTANTWALVFYVFIAVTDWLDGWWARKFQATSKMGRFLDPLADKLFVLASMVVLLDIERIHVTLVIISLLRELSIQGLRGMAAEQNLCIPSTSGGKTKTGFQLFGIGFLILGPNLDFWFKEVFDTNFFVSFLEIGSSLIIISLAFSLFSAGEYLKNFLDKQPSK